MGMTSLKNFGALLASVIITFSFVFAMHSGIKLTGATIVSNQVAANVVVPTFCSLGISNTAVNFGVVSAGTSVATGNLVVVNSANANVNGNVFIAGNGITGPGTNNFFIANILWNPTSQAVGIGNALTTYTNSLIGPVDTKITLASAGQTNIFFGISIPVGQAAGTYTANAVFQNNCKNIGANSIQVTNTVITVNVPSACFITISNTLINFGSINPGSNVNTANLVVDTNTGGNVNANILVAGGNWISGANNFFVTNTLWAATTQGSYSGTPLQHSVLSGFVDTNIMIVYPPTSSSNNIFFGVAVPPAQASGTYTQNIIMENSC